MATAGPNSPVSAVNNSSAGTVAWTNPGNATTLNGLDATVSLTNARSQYLWCTDFGFAIPADGTIDGILVEVFGFETYTSGGRSQSARMIKAGVLVGSEQANWFGAGEQYYPIGGATSKWGTTWTPAQINAANFGVAVWFDTTPTGVCAFNIDHVRITIYYTLPQYPAYRYRSQTAIKRM